MTDKTNCPDCDITFKGLEIPQGLLEGNPSHEPYKDSNILHEAAKQYGWTPENKRTFTINCIYVKDLWDDSLNYIQCKSCGHTFK